MSDLMAAATYKTLRFAQPAILLAGVLFSSPLALAQDGETILSKSWNYFIERCSRAYTEPQRYLDDLAFGRGEVVSTQDGAVIWSGINEDPLHNTFQVFASGKRHRQQCYVMGHFDTDPTSAEKLNDDFVQNVASKIRTTVTGGRSSKELDRFYPVIPYRYVVLGALPNDIIVFITIAPRVIEIDSTYEFEKD